MKRCACLVPLAGVLMGATAAYAQATRDSAGVQIVENRTPLFPAARAWRVDPRPTLTIGDPNGPAAADTMYELSLVMGVARLDNGQWAVALQSASSIRFYDASGLFVRSASRSGQGPGELGQVLGMFRLAGDTLLVSDIGDAEYFTGDGRWVRLGASRSQALSPNVFPWAAFDDQSFAGLALDDPVERPLVLGARPLPLVFVSRDGLDRRTVAVVRARAAGAAGASPMSMPPVFSPQPQFAGDGKTLFYAFGAPYEVSAFTSDGRNVRIIRRAHVPVDVTARVRSEYVTYRHRIAEAANGGVPLATQDMARLDQYLARLSFAERLPAIGALLADRAGNLWVRAYDLRETITVARVGRGEILPSRATPVYASSWDVFDPRGRWLCTVELPSRFTPLDIGNDYVAGLARDADDVEMVRVYRLVKP